MSDIEAFVDKYIPPGPIHLSRSRLIELLQKFENWQGGLSTSLTFPPPVSRPAPTAEEIDEIMCVVHNLKRHQLAFVADPTGKPLMISDFKPDCVLSIPLSGPVNIQIIRGEWPRDSRTHVDGTLRLHVQKTLLVAESTRHRLAQFDLVTGVHEISVRCYEEQSSAADIIIRLTPKKEIKMPPVLIDQG